MYASDFNADIKELFEDAFKRQKPGYHRMYPVNTCNRATYPEGSRSKVTRENLIKVQAPTVASTHGT